MGSYFQSWEHQHQTIQDISIPYALDVIESIGPQPAWSVLSRMLYVNQW